MEKQSFLVKMLFGGVVCAVAGCAAWRCRARRQQDPAAEGSPRAAGGDSAPSATAGDGKDPNSEGSTSAGAVHRLGAAGPCPRPRPPAAAGADDAHSQDPPTTPRAAPPANHGEPERGADAGAAAAAGARAPAPPQEREGDLADIPAPRDAAPAPATTSSRPFRPSGAWRAKGNRRPEACPDDYVSPQQRQEEKEAADDVSIILPHLYLSSYLGAGAQPKLQQMGVKHILCLDAELKPKHPGNFTYKSLDLQDDLYADVLAQLPEAISFIQHAKQSGGGSLVHCQLGRSRSATTVLAYLMLRGGQDLRAAWAQTYAARPMICPNVAFRRQLLRLQQMARTAGDAFQDHPLFAFHLAEISLINTKLARIVQNPLDLCVDPAEYAQQVLCGGGGGRALQGLLCIKCGRLLASPLNLLWLGGKLWNDPGTGTAASDEHNAGDAIIEVIYGSLPTGADPESPEGAAHSLTPEAVVVRCLGCQSVIGSCRDTSSAVADANEREPLSGQWQRAAGALASGAPADLLPRWCAALHRGRTRIAPVTPLPSVSHSCPELRAAAAAMRQE